MRAALAHRDFRLLWLAQATSTIGAELVPVALALFVVGLTGSASDLGLVLAARYVTLVGFLLVGGAWADRLPRQLVMVASDLVRFTTHAVLAALIFAGAVEIWQLVVLQAVSGTAEAFFRPAYAGLVPQTVPGPLVQPATALSGLTMTVSEFAGPALATTLVLTAGAGWAFAADAATYLVSAALLIRVRPARRAGAEPARAREPLLREIAAGWQEVRSRAWVWVTIVVFAVGLLVAFAPLNTLGPLVARDRYGDVAVYGVFMTLFGAGLALGALTGLRWRPERPLRIGLAAAILWPLAVVSLALGLPLAVVGPLTVVAGAGLMLFGVWWDTALATHIPPGLLSRVSAWDWMGSNALMPIGLLLAGPVGERVGPANALAAGGALAVIAMAAGCLPRSSRELRSSPAAPVPAATSPLGAPAEP